MQIKPKFIIRRIKNSVVITFEAFEKKTNIHLYS